MQSEAVIPEGAPGCYGAATVFASDSDVCQSCQSFAGCGQESERTLATIKGLINVEDLLRRHRKTRAAVVKPADPLPQPAPPSPYMPAMKPVERETPVVKVELAIDETHQAVVAKLPIKPREIAIRLCKSGVISEAKNALAQGRNPFDTGAPEFLRVAAGRLLSGGFSKRELRETFVSELKWSEGTASSHVGITCAILEGFRIAQERSGRYALTPASA